ncbi:MAG: phosphotransferase [Candidatus Alcyoniella australis]|nr:phosphotransferase [Candidatus Alcyoniella australis]
MSLKPEQLDSLINRLFRTAVDGVELARLPGDASDRNYYRLSADRGGRISSYVVMQILDLPNKLHSEEVMLYHDENGELPFINIHRHLSHAGIPVPQVMLYDAVQGLMVLEDLGDVMLQDLALTVESARRIELYCAALDILVQIHRRATKLLDGSDCMATEQRFNTAMYQWEFEHFIEYGVEARGGVKIEPAVRERVKEIFAHYSRELDALPVVFTHRDFHSRNIMLLDDGRMRVIDFQDALLAPRVYDLASLLYDSYVELPEEQIYQLLDYYDRATADEPDRKEQGELRLHFEMAAVQRNLKAAGRFVYIQCVKGNDSLVKYVPQTLGYVRRNLPKLPRGAEALELLAPYVGEWRD